LRDRREDIPLLLSHFLYLYAQRHGRRVLGYAPRAVKTLMGYAFPGNIRELQNMVERGVISADEGGVIDLPHMLRKEALGEGGWLSLTAAGALAAEPEAAGPPPPASADAPLFDRLADPVSQTLDLARLERALMDGAVTRAGGNLAAAARLLGLSRAQLAYRLKQGRGGHGPVAQP
jgi:DNA-binding NtrC family response regulator